MADWSWTWHGHPEVWVLAVFLLVAYRLALRHLGPRAVAHGEEIATGKQRRSFTLAVIVLVIASEWPVHDLAEGHLYSVHMIQHLLLTLIMAALFLRGIPAWLLRTLMPPRAMAVVRRLSRPLVALIVFNAVIVGTHWPLMVEWSVRFEAVHFVQHVVLVGAALLMWMPIFSPVLEIPRLSYPGQMVYLFLQSLVPTVPASFLTFGDRPLYAIYETFPRVLGISALSDMRTAGLIMKIAGGVVLWAVIAVVFFRWAELERSSGMDALEMHDVDRAMNRMELNH